MMSDDIVASHLTVGLFARHRWTCRPLAELLFTYTDLGEHGICKIARSFDIITALRAAQSCEQSYEYSRNVQMLSTHRIWVMSRLRVRWQAQAVVQRPSVVPCLIYWYTALRYLNRGPAMTTG